MKKLKLEDLLPYILYLLVGRRETSSESTKYQASTEITIAIVGRSGSGVSQLIQDVTHIKDYVAPNGWHLRNYNKTYTPVIRAHRYRIPGFSYILTFIDTPGFGYFTGDIHTALNSLHKWLLESSKPCLLDGLIIMHDACIDERHDKYIPRYDILEKLCGRDWIGKVAFATSHWDLVDDSERQSKVDTFEEYWSHMAVLGARKMGQYCPSNSGASAWDILRPLVNGTLNARRKRLKKEQDGLHEGIKKLSDDSPDVSTILNRLGDVINGKIDLMETITPRLGRGDSVMTNKDFELYAKLKKNGEDLWDNVTKILDGMKSEELEALENILFLAKDQSSTITIAIVGSIRSGRSRFVYETTGKGENRVGNQGTLHPYTKDFSSTICSITVPGVEMQHEFFIRLVETPGFVYDYLERDEKRVLERLWKYLGPKSMEARPKLDGLIYLHDIHNNDLHEVDSPFLTRVPFVSDSWWDINDWPGHIFFVSSFWSEENSETAMSAKEMEKREAEIRETYWKFGKVSAMRWGDSAQNSQEILRTALSQIIQRRPIRIASVFHSLKNSPIDVNSYLSVVGRTGSGMSQFIHDLTGNYSYGVSSSEGGDMSTPFTQSIQSVSYSIPEISPTRTYVLIDTPGFDYSRENTEYDMFKKLADWCGKSYGTDARLDGVIYMHNIWDEELKHRSPLLTSDVLEGLCGTQWRKKVVLVNSHWSEQVKDDGDVRETQLQDGYWRVMLSMGSVMTRYEEPGRRQRALEILKLVIEN